MLIDSGLLIMSSERYHSFEESQGIRIHHEIQLCISLHNFTLHFGISATSKIYS